jgi:hypothetical protein
MPITQAIPPYMVPIPADETGADNNATGTGQPQTYTSPGKVSVTVVHVKPKVTPGGAAGSVTIVDGKPTTYTPPS